MTFSYPYKKVISSYSLVLLIRVCDITIPVSHNETLVGFTDEATPMFDIDFDAPLIPKGY